MLSLQSDVLQGSPMKIGIIGAGTLGRALGARLEAQGHRIQFGERDSVRDAADFGDLVVLAVPFTALDGALANAAAYAGKVVWSCVNALTEDMSGLAVGFDNSAAEEVARRIPGARVVAAVPPFARAIADPPLTYDEGLVPSVFVCGDDQSAKQLVAGLVRDIGAEPVDAGPLTSARFAEPAMMLVIRLAYGSDPRRDVGMRLLER